ncbi:MAG: IS1 family transposase [Desulfosarcina sp.]|nr:IS1 family transposase [Desulfobacterales bacterium]
MAIGPKCSSEKCVIDGIVKGKQRYRCKSCDFRHTVQHRGNSPDVKRQALELYLEDWDFVIFLQDSEGRLNASVFRHALNAQMERWAISYIKLTMPLLKPAFIQAC